MNPSELPRALLAVACVMVLASVADPAMAQDHRQGGERTDIGESVRFQNGSTLLAGSVLVPAGPGPHPAFVILMGSGDSSYRGSWEPGSFPFWKDISEFLVGQGYAVLLFDKPGVAASTGDWREQSFVDRSEEAVAAIRHLVSRSDIDPARIGLVGHSQGGWIAQIAAARAPDDVAFLILLAGPAVTVKQQIRDDMASGWTCRGVSRPGFAARSAGLRLGSGVLGLFAKVATPGYLSRIINFDPREVLPGIRQPTLALFAENDPLVLPEPNRARLQRYFGTAQGTPRLAVRTVPGADHFFRASEACPANRATEWAPAFFEALDDPDYWSWL